MAKAIWHWGFNTGLELKVPMPQEASGRSVLELLDVLDPRTFGERVFNAWTQDRERLTTDD